MLKQKHKILFVSHTADRNGAPLYLLGIINEFKKQSDLPFRIVVMKDGVVTPDFKAAGETFVWDKEIRGSGRLTRLFAKLTGFLRKRYILFCLRDTTLVFMNTITNGHIQEKLLFTGCKFICYVHELEAVIHRATNEHTRNIVLNNTNYFLAGSEAVKRNLVNTHKIDSNNIKVIYTSMQQVFRVKSDHLEYIEAFRNKHGIPDDAVIIGVAGPNEWRKGFDMFLPLIRIYFNLFPQSNVYFVWKGFKTDHWASFQDMYDYKKSNTPDRVLLLPHGTDNIEQIACFDIHLLLSREDPYPVVVLEAASFAVPTVCFTDAGGSPEFVEHDSGFCVPYGDLMAMAARLHELAENTSLRNIMGLTAQQKVRSRHHQKKATSEIIEVMQHVLYAGIPGHAVL